jgi:hypothetical protein
LNDAHNGFRRSRGVALATPNLADRSSFNPTSDYSPEDAIELQVHENGGLRLFSSRLSNHRGQGPSPDEQVIIERVAVNHTRRFLALVIAAGELGHRRSGAELLHRRRRAGTGPQPEKSSQARTEIPSASMTPWPSRSASR